MALLLYNFPEMARVGGGFETLDVDSNAKPTFPLVSQVWKSTKRSGKKSQAPPYQDQLNAIHVARGPIASVLLINPMFSESIPAAAVLYMGRFNLNRRNSVLFFVADVVGPPLRETTQRVFPNIR